MQPGVQTQPITLRHALAAFLATAVFFIAAIIRESRSRRLA